MPAATPHPRAFLLWLSLGVMDCQGQWSGKPSLPTQVDAMRPTYREWQADEGWVLYTLRAPAVQHLSDVFYLGTLDDVSEYARDDGRPPDRTAGDGEFTGRYLAAKRRQNPMSWKARTRASKLGETGRAVPNATAATHPYAHRQDMAGGTGGEWDGHSLCPPGYVLAGAKVRRDMNGNNISHLAALCRPLPRAGVDAAAMPLVEGTGWGDDVGNAPVEEVTCPPGSAVLGQATASMGRWRTYSVLGGLVFECGRISDVQHTLLTPLEVGGPAPQVNERLPFQCHEARMGHPIPLAAGLRVIAGVRIDAVGLFCDEDPGKRAAAVTALRLTALRGPTSELAFPLRALKDRPFFVRMVSKGHTPGVHKNVLTLSDDPARILLEPVEGVTTVQAVAEGCVLHAENDVVVLAHGPSRCADLPNGVTFYSQYRARAEWRARSGMRVTMAEELGKLRGSPELHLRMVSAATAGDDPQGVLLDVGLTSIPPPEHQRLLVLPQGAP
jgi:hypothetical protein